MPLLCLLLPSAASARTSLDGEFLSSLPPATITSASCDYQDGSTLSFEISGVSGAPYAGTFHETGTVTLGPQNEEIAPGLNQYRSRITGFEATFTIDSPAGTVRGTKSLMPGSDTYDYAVCDPFPSMAQVIASQLTYDATITLPDGSSFGEHGNAGDNFNAYDPSIFPTGTASSNEFRGYFWSPQPVGDTSAPRLTAPNAIHVPATGTDGATVDYDVSATDDTDPNPMVSCTPPSGSVFPVGTTTVACSATDASGNSSGASFEVTVDVPVAAPEPPTITDPPYGGRQHIHGHARPGAHVICRHGGVVLFDVVADADGNWGADVTLGAGDVLDITQDDGAGGGESDPLRVTTGPTPVVTGFSAGGATTNTIQPGGATNGKSITFTGHGVPGNRVVIRASMHGEPRHPQTFGTAVVDDDGDWEIDGTIEDCHWDFWAVQIDPAGDESDPTADYLIYVDHSAPDISVTGIDDGGVYTDGAAGRVTISDPAPAGEEPDHAAGIDWSRTAVTLDGQPVSVTPDQDTPISSAAPGKHTLVVTATDRAGNQSSRTVTFTVRHRTAVTYTGPTVMANGDTPRLSGTLVDTTSHQPLAGQPVTLTVGSGPKARGCTDTTDSAGKVACTVSGALAEPLGPDSATGHYDGTAAYLPSDTRADVTVFAWPASGAFVVGDKTVGTPVSASVGKSGLTWWGAQWAASNALSGGAAPAAFKGYADVPASAAACGTGYTTRPGNSAQPPATVPSYMGVIVSSKATKSGSAIAGDVKAVVVVKTDGSYAGNPGHAGTGTIVAVACS